MSHLEKMTGTFFVLVVKTVENHSFLLYRFSLEFSHSSHWFAGIFYSPHPPKDTTAVLRNFKSGMRWTRTGCEGLICGFTFPDARKMAPYAPWCWNIYLYIYLHIYPIFMAEFCRSMYHHASHMALNLRLRKHRNENFKMIPVLLRWDPLYLLMDEFFLMDKALRSPCLQSTSSNHIKSLNVQSLRNRVYDSSWILLGISSIEWGGHPSDIVDLLGGSSHFVRRLYPQLEVG